MIFSKSGNSRHVPYLLIGNLIYAPIEDDGSEKEDILEALDIIESSVEFDRSFTRKEFQKFAKKINKEAK